MTVERPKLEVWQKAMDLTVSVYEATKTFPREELYSLTIQIRRAAISIPSNIAEGRAKRSTRDFMRFVNIAAGSTAELETQILLSEKLGYLPPTIVSFLLENIDHIGRMLNKLYIGLEKKLASEPRTSNL